MITTADALFAAIAADPADRAAREVYADALEQAGDPRAALVRGQLALGPLPPDHPERPALEAALGPLRAAAKASAAWLAVIEPEGVPVDHATCFYDEAVDDEDDGLPGYPPPRWRPTQLHARPQDTACAGWRHLCELVDEAARTGATSFVPMRKLARDELLQIITLPVSIAALVAVEELVLYGSALERIPAEIAGMANLRTFMPYTSYGLHWFPYEITRCRRLADSTVSTRALYGNFKFRPPFPSLAARLARPVTRTCSVCAHPFHDSHAHRAWTSQRVATDVLPLLVNACSQACLDAIPDAPDGYVRRPHRGGVDVVQHAPT